MQVLYFSWLRERVGVGQEEIQSEAQTAADLIADLKTRSQSHAAAFDDVSAIRVAVDQKMVDLDAPVTGAREIAFFPPMTGG